MTQRAVLLLILFSVAIVGLFALNDWLDRAPFVPPVPLGDGIDTRHLTGPALARPYPEPDEPFHPAIQRLFDQPGGPTTDSDSIDPDRLLAETNYVDTGGEYVMPFLAPEVRALARETARVLLTNGPLPGVLRWQLFQVIPLVAVDDLLLITRAETATGTVPLRFWVQHDQGQFRIYDFEDARLGVRLSELFAAQLSGTTEPAVLDKLQQSTAAIATGDLRQGDQLLQDLFRLRIGRTHRVLAFTQCGLLAVQVRQPARIQQMAELIESVRPGTPAADYLRAHAALLRGEPAAALQAADRYEAAV
ncbi:MAG: hypothetical protein ACRCZF_05390, partial [Gemmataceae bacterium]